MAAEIAPDVVLALQGLAASMRPRRMAAEIPAPGSGPGASGRRFNEAAANGRGNHPAPQHDPSPSGASMRPRRMAAEIDWDSFFDSLDWRRFNEAAANGRGNRGRPCPS